MSQITLVRNKQLPSTQASLNFGAVVIGRNEGERLKLCIASLSAATRIVYVDSGSTDGSVDWARAHGADVVELDSAVAFTAARARNSGFRRLRDLVADLPYVQFVDGDCEVDRDWPGSAVSYLNANPSVAAVCGHLRERYPERSVYNWLCAREWEGPPGETRAFGGNVMMRAAALAAASGYRDDLIAGEEPELGVRLRAAGWHLWRLDTNMALHDAAMTSFRQWWRRMIRNGYAFALGAFLHGAPPERHWVWETRRAWLWGVWLPLGCLAVGLAFGPWSWLAWLVYPLQLLRQTARNSGSLRERATLALFQLLGRFPEALGAIKFTCDRLLGSRAHIVVHK